MVAWCAMNTRAVSEILKDHVQFELECVDRLYLNGYVPSLQTGGGISYFFGVHRGQPVVSPALLEQMRKDWIQRLETWMAQEQVPLVPFEKGQRKDDLAQRRRARWQGEAGVVFVGSAQEKEWAFSGVKRVSERGTVSFDFARKQVFVKHYYFYFEDEEWGPGFLKVCSYFPFAMKLCVNGHEWAKVQAAKQGLAFTALDNGFSTCAEASRLQKLCDKLSERDLEALLCRLRARIPWPWTPADQRAGYDWTLSIWQLETSLTQVFDQPRHGRELFESIIRDKLDLGRPERVALVVERRISARTPGKFATRILTRDIHPSLHISYKHCGIKQYFKEGRALRTETTINNPRDFAVGKALKNFCHLRQIGRHCNRRLLDVERAGDMTCYSSQTLQRLIEPSVTSDGTRAPGLKYGSPRVMALLAALHLMLTVPAGFRHGALRRQVARLLGVEEAEYRSTQMSYDLRRLRLKGLITRQPGTQRYTVTPYGLNLAAMLTRLHQRVLRAACAAVDALPEASDPPPRLRAALHELQASISELCDRAHLAKAA